MNRFNVNIFTTKSPDIDKWREMLNKNPQADIFFTPEYAKIFENSRGATGEAFGGQAALFFFGENGNFILHPFLKRAVDASGEWFDIASPYGYSGPLAYISDPGLEGEIWKGFLEEFRSYCNREKIVSEFVRLHPYLKNHLPLEKYSHNDLEIKRRQEVVYIDLKQNEAAIKKGMDKGNKSSLAKARRSGIEITRSKAKDEIEAYCRLYLETMKRNNAGQAYFFSLSFFNDLFNLMGDSIELFCARYNNRIIAASAFIFKGDFCHYFLSGSDSEFLGLCPNNLLIYEAISWAKGMGFKLLNLGGGNRLGDRLFSFKSSFSNNHAPFYTYSRIHQEDIYEMLSNDRRRTIAGDLKKDYFPAYRS